jgi:hypothetical protein
MRGWQEAQATDLLTLEALLWTLLLHWLQSRLRTS